MLYMTRESYQTRYVSIKCYYYYEQVHTVMTLLLRRNWRKYQI